jgi:cell division protein FtsL
MPFLTKGKTNWKCISIVVILAIVIGSGILVWQYFQIKHELLIKATQVKELTKETEDLKKQIEDLKEEKLKVEAELKKEIEDLKKQIEDLKKKLIKVETTNNWVIYKNEEYGFEIKYPKDFFYSSLPKVTVSDCNYQDFLSKMCGAPKTVNNIPACWGTGEPEGAAGSRYFDYIFNAFKDKDKKCFSLSFVMRISNCGMFGFPGEKAYEECQYFNSVTVPKTFQEIPYTFKFLE